MGQKSGSANEPSKQVVKEIRRATRWQFSVEEKISIVLTGPRGEDSNHRAVPPRRIVQKFYYRWSKEFLKAGKKRLAGDTARAPTSDEVKDLRQDISALIALKEVVAELMLENRLLKKGAIGAGGTVHQILRRRKVEIIRLVESPLPVRDTPGATRYSAGDLLPLVRPAEPRRAGDLERLIISTRSGLEPNS